MRRLAALLAVAAGLVLAPAAQGAGAGAVLLECERGERGWAEFQATMDASSGAARMQMRFTLQARRSGRRGGYRRVAAPGFGTWSTADPGVSRYTYTRRVENLIGPARYRVLVRFRWLDAAGRVIDRDRVRSRSCRQPDLRPDLEIAELAIADAAARGQDRYRVVVRNRGRSATGPFDLELSIGGTAAAPVRVDDVAARRERPVEIVGPACERGDEVTVTADPADAVAERSERDNALTLICP